MPSKKPARSPEKVIFKNPVFNRSAEFDKPKHPPRPEIKQAAEKLVLLSRLANMEVNQTIIAAQVRALEHTVNDTLDLMVDQFEKVIGHNFAGPFKAKLKELSERYDAIAKPAEGVGPAKPPETGEPK